MRKSSLLLFISIVFFSLGSLNAQSAFINEVNYMASDPAGNGVEIAGESGENVQGWSVVLYQLDGTVDQVETLEYKLIPSQQNGYGTVWYEMEQLSGGQGLALVNPTGSVVQFIGIGAATLTGITASEGPASGMTTEYAGTQLLPNQSLQLTGTGLELLDFAWSLPLSFTPGTVNTNQSFGGSLLGGYLGLQAPESNTLPTEQLSDKQLDINIYPNPTIDVLRLQRSFTDLEEDTLPVQLFDANGRLIRRAQMTAGQDYLELDLRDLSAGHYLLSIGKGPSRIVQQVLKQ